MKCACNSRNHTDRGVAPHAGAWIEISNILFNLLDVTSLPMRERGLKYNQKELEEQTGMVAPHAGAWIEMYFFLIIDHCRLSLPMRERGLKFKVYGIKSSC